MIYFLGNGVIFKTRPSLNRTKEGTFVTGCQYFSSRNIDLSEYAFIKFGERLLQINSSINNVVVSYQNNNISTFPEYRLKDGMESGNISCIIKIGEETFSSNTSTLYKFPGTSMTYHFYNYPS